MIATISRITGRVPSLGCAIAISSSPALAETVTILPSRPTSLPAPEQLALTKKIHALIIEKAKEEAHQNYQLTAPKAKDTTLQLVAIPGGEFQLGSPENEQPLVTISPFWMSATEVTWGLYDPFWQNDPDFKKPRNKDGSRDLDNDLSLIHI